MQVINGSEINENQAQNSNLIDTCGEKKKFEGKEEFVKWYIENRTNSNGESKEDVQ